MLTENQQKWVAALRSGDYEQGRGSLQRGDKYCCLGVACVVAEINGVSVTKFEGEIDGGGLWSQKAVKDWVGLSDKEGRLISANDRDEWSFAEIADLIESNPSGLFVKVSE